MCKITWKTDYKIGVVQSLTGSVWGTVALSMGRNVSGCQPLWGWAIAVVVLNYWGLLSLICSNPAKLIEKSKKYSNGNLVCMVITLGFPTVVLFVMGLIVIGSPGCREKWEDHNPVLLYFSVVYGGVALVLSLLNLFFHECWVTNNGEVHNGGPGVHPPREICGPVIPPPVAPPAPEYGTNPRYIDEEEGH
jgi:hypothetical protein